jgi:nicotinate-nucleotide--dimethylbenzimidazole phosphoribosyltransferase
VTTPTLEELAVAVERPDDDSRAAARAALGPHAGVLGDLATWLAGVQRGAVPAAPRRPRLVALADELPARTTGLAADLAVDVAHLPRRGTVGAVDSDDGCSRDEALAAVLAGAARADEEADAGTDLLMLALPSPDLAVPAATLVGLLTRSDASAVTATDLDDATWMVRCAATRDAMRRGRALLTDHPALLAAVAGADLAFATGLLLQAAARRTPVLLDGPVSAAAALVAARLSFRAPGWWLAAGVSPDPAHRLALGRLDLDPVLDLGLRGDDGTAALLAVPVLRAAAHPPPTPGPA